MSRLDDWQDFVNECIAKDNISLIAHRLFYLEEERDKMREALQSCKTRIEQALPVEGL